jgi:hypothetical protein
MQVLSIALSKEVNPQLLLVQSAITARCLAGLCNLGLAG